MLFLRVQLPSHFTPKRILYAFLKTTVAFTFHPVFLPVLAPWSLTFALVFCLFVFYQVVYPEQNDLPCFSTNVCTLGNNICPVFLPTCVPWAQRFALFSHQFFYTGHKHFALFFYQFLYPGHRHYFATPQCWHVGLARCLVWATRCQNVEVGKFS